MGSKDLGLRIKRLREVRGLSQLALAKRAGISQSHLSEVEAGERPSPGVEFVERVARALCVFRSELLDDDQGAFEMWVFWRFAQAAHLGVRRESIEKRRPPEPDIRCVTREGPYAFELVQLVEKVIAKRENDRRSVEGLLHKKWQTMASKGLENASLYVAFREDPSLGRQKVAVESLIELLRTLPPNIEGDVGIDRRSPLTKTVRRLHISRWPKLSGPIFTVASGGPFSNPPIQTIESHFGTRYESDAPIDLVIYYSWQPVIPQTWSHPELLAFITKELPNSPFQRVWVCDMASESILFVHPPLT